MGKLALHMQIAAMLKKPPLPSGPKRALHMGNTPEKTKKKGYKPTGELALFKEIAREQEVNGEVVAKHMDKDGNECTKTIRVEDLKPENFSHILGKWMHPEKRLDKENIEIVSRAWHFFEHNQQVLQVEYPN